MAALDRFPVFHSSHLAFCNAHPRTRLNCRTRVAICCELSAEKRPTQKGVDTKSAVLVIELNGTERRSYVANGSAVSSVEVSSSSSGEGEEGATSGPIKRVTDTVQGLFLPRNFPHSVTDDYLQYQLWGLPTHITGWISHSLATSNLLQAIGLGTGAMGATAASAAIKWITKDGLGALGRLIVGGPLSGVFDEDPRRWRFNAEIMTTTGLALEIATALSPANFLLLAGSGNLAKAVGKGMGRPAFRVIQTHFSASNNVGDVAAKEEVWEVVGQLSGLLASVVALRALEPIGTAESVLGLWLVVHSVHVVLRWKMLSSLRFPYPNQKRACALVTAHVAHNTVTGVVEVNAGENMFVDPLRCSPCVAFGVSIREALEADQKVDEVVPHLADLLQLYRNEQYVLVWRAGRGYCVLRTGANSQHCMRALWQAAWLQHQGVTCATRDDVIHSLTQLNDRFDDFLSQARAAGWKMDDALFVVEGNRLEQWTVPDTA